MPTCLKVNQALIQRLSLMIFLILRHKPLPLPAVLTSFRTQTRVGKYSSTEDPTWISGNGKCTNFKISLNLELTLDNTNLVKKK